MIIGTIYVFETIEVESRLITNIRNYIAGFLFEVNFLSQIPIGFARYNYYAAIKKTETKNINECFFVTFLALKILNIAAFVTVFAF